MARPGGDRSYAGSVVAISNECEPPDVCLTPVRRSPDVCLTPVRRGQKLKARPAKKVWTRSSSVAVAVA